MHAWAITNKLSGLAASAFTWGSSGPADATRVYVNDGRLDKQYIANSVASTASVIIDLGSAKALTCVAALNTNLRDATTPAMVVEGADDSGMSVNLVTAKAASTLNITDYYGQTAKDHVLQFASVTKRYWRVSWTWSGTFQMKVGELFAGVTTALTRQDVYGGSSSYVTKVVANEMMYGERRAAFFAGPIRERRMRWQDLTLAQANELRAIWDATRGPVTPLLWAESYEATATAAAASEQECLYGRLMVDSFPITNDDFGLYQAPELVIRSLGREVGA